MLCSTITRNIVAVVLLMPSLMMGDGPGDVFARTSPSAGDIYVPDRIKVTARVYQDWDYSGLRNPPPRSAPQQVEAWYFQDVCIVSQGYPPLPGHPPEKWVYAYWYDGKSRNGESAFQQWGSPRAKASIRADPARLPQEALPVNPLWYLLDFQKQISAAKEKVKISPSAAGTRTVLIHGEPYISDQRNETYDNNFLIKDDRVLSSTLVRNTTYPRQKAHPDFVPPEDKSDVLYELVASDFDEQFPAVPRKIEKVRSAYGKNMVTEVDSISAIPPDVTPDDVIQKATAGLQHIRLDEDGFRVRTPHEDFVVQTLAGEKVRLTDLIRGKTALVYLWASWAPKNLFNNTYGKEVRTGFDVLERLKSVYKKYGSDPDVVIIGLSVDPDPAAAKAFADAHQFPWQSYMVPADLRRDALWTFGDDGDELPSAIAINRRGESSLYGIRGLTGVLGYSSGQQLQAGEDPSLPFSHIVKEDRAATAAGGYAKHWLGEEVIEVLTNYEEVQVCALTGHHMDELLVVANMPPMPLPPIPGQPPPPTPTPRPYNMPTSVSVLGSYPVKQKAVVKETGPAREVARMLLDDKAVISQFGEESLPYYKRAIAFRKGKDIVGIAGRGKEIQVYLNEDRKAWLWLSDEATAKLNNIYLQMAKAAGVRVAKD